MMLTQSPSKIFKADFAVWEKHENFLVNHLIDRENSVGNLQRVSEVVIDENSHCILEVSENTVVFILPVFGEVFIENYSETLSTNEFFTISGSDFSELRIKNNLSDEKADLLVFEFNIPAPKISEKNQLEISEKNLLFPISEKLQIPNFIGLFEGRKEAEITFKKNTQVFAMVLNGAFEFQNRLLENRDAIVLYEAETVEMEALSQNALIIIFEI